MSSAPQSDRPKKVTAQGLSDYLCGRSVENIYLLVKRGGIPFQRVGKIFYFDLDAIDAWMKQGQEGDETFG